MKACIVHGHLIGHATMKLKHNEAETQLLAFGCLVLSLEKAWSWCCLGLERPQR